MDNGFCVPHWCPLSACEFDYLSVMGSFPFLRKKPASHLSQLLNPGGWQSRQTGSQAHERARECYFSTLLQLPQGLSLFRV